jgi:hypothetical protein
MVDPNTAFSRKIEELLEKNAHYNQLIDRLTTNHERMLYRRVEHQTFKELQRIKAMQDRIHAIAEKRFQEKKDKQKEEFLNNLRKCRISTTDPNRRRFAL